MSLTDEQVEQRLATRMGYEQRMTTGVRYLRWFTKGGTITMHPQAMLVSLDALQPVLATLTPAEWVKLYYALPTKAANRMALLREVLPMPAHTLAHAIAEVLPAAPEHTT